MRTRQRLGLRLILWVGLILLGTIGTWAYFTIDYEKKKAVRQTARSAERLGNTIQLGARYAMMTNARDDINQIIIHIAQQKDIGSIRIYNKAGQIKFSGSEDEVNRVTDIRDAACHICHRADPPLVTVDVMERIRIFRDRDGTRQLGIISPIYNEASCSSGLCHVHPPEKKVLGLLDISFSLSETDHELQVYERGIIGLAAAAFLGAAGGIGLFILRFVNRPIAELIRGTERFGRGQFDHKVEIHRNDEIGQLAEALNRMGEHLNRQQAALNEQRDEYQRLFEGVPCYITVQDRELRLLRYNHEFAEKFGPTVGELCYKAYKGRSTPCDPCPVLKTFETGRSQSSEETGIHKDGRTSYWVVRTAPIRNASGQIVAAMEMSLDVTRIRILEQEARRSEQRYRTIFNTIPNPVFVLDRQDLRILDCNHSVSHVYGFSKEEILNRSFLDLFPAKERTRVLQDIKTLRTMDHARQETKTGRSIFVNIRISPSEYLGRNVFLVTTSDITQRLLAEQQLIQAGKMATLGEMATGVAHELNQPLSVIKTASSFIMRKVRQGAPISQEILESLAAEIDSHVDRAARIINHMREFGRKSEVKKSRVQVNEHLQKALEIFKQQLRLRQIDVQMELQPGLPCIMAEANRLEQVFINLLINARDAIEERSAQEGQPGEKRIALQTRQEGDWVIIVIEDTGTGIPEEILDKIFEPFFTTKKVGKGTGLGLSISYGIVQDYEGTIHAESRPGKGARFILRFPAAGDA